MRRQGAHCYAVHMERTTINSSASKENYPTELIELLIEFSPLFADPKGLPLKRIFDHHIPLKDKTNHNL